MVFLGPCLSHDKAREILDADYRPPVKRGDLTSLLPSVRTVAIIDGILLSDAAVGHREILGLLKQGVTVYGGGSMGALRAAELKDFGMIGVGRVFEEYASGRVEGDDEVVLAYDPYTQTALSEPLINIRLNLEAAVGENVLSREEEALLLDALKRTYYPKRSYTLMLDITRSALGSDIAEDLEDFMGTRGIDFKQNDAISVLKTVKINRV